MLIAAFFLTAGIAPEKKSKPVIYLIGDSTVRNGSGKGEGGLWGWGNYLYAQFDTSKVSIRNYALGGRSSRTFISEGLWDKVLAKLKPGDYVFIQFGHNDSSPVNDNSRARGTLKGAVPVVCSLVPRNIWENGKVMRASEDYGKWAKESAQAGKAYFIDLNEIIAAKYDALGENEVTTKLFLTDHTHTNEAGAIINAQAVTEGIKSLNNCKLKKYLMN